MNKFIHVTYAPTFTVQHFLMCDCITSDVYVLCHFMLSLITEHQTAMAITIADLKEVYRTTFKARSKWKNILLELDISSVTIESIGVSCHNNPDDCYREGLREWLEGGERSWKDLVEALSSPTVGYKDIAFVIDRSLPLSLSQQKQKFKIVSYSNILNCFISSSI